MQFTTSAAHDRRPLRWAGSGRTGRAWSSGPVAAAVWVLLGTAAYLGLGPVTPASAAVPLTPVMVTVGLDKDTVIAGQEQGVMKVDLTLAAGESRRVIGQVEARIERLESVDDKSIDDTVDIRCFDVLTGEIAGTSTWAETSLVPGKIDLLRPPLLVAGGDVRQGDHERPQEPDVSAGERRR